jgi:outer membrane biosynthesis protein TonB
MSRRIRRPAVGIAGLATGIAALVAAVATPTTSAFLTDVESIHVSAQAGSWDVACDDQRPVGKLCDSSVKAQESEPDPKPDAESGNDVGKGHGDPAEPGADEPEAPRAEEPAAAPGPTQEPTQEPAPTQEPKAEPELKPEPEPTPTAEPDEAESDATKPATATAATDIDAA